MNPQGSGVSVIICAYTEQRWAELLQAVESVNRQEPPPAEIILVIDHNPPLLERTRACFPDLTVLENEHEPGLSGARNTGIAAARGEIIAFLDEDAIASPGWLTHLLEGYQDAAVLGVGGKIIPLWVVEKPGWFPEEFQWVVGCSYRGLPENPAPVRNLIGCNMSFRRIAFTNSQGLRLDIGRIGNRPLGCEETEFCIRLLGDNPGKQLLYLPSAQVDHSVPSPRRSFRYFLSRCYAEGLSKAQVARYVGAARGLSSERRYTLRGFRLSVTKYPDGPRADYATYWLGEAFYVQKDYTTALKLFQKVVATFPDSRKGPDAMLKVAYSQYELKAFRNARATLQKVVATYPGTDAQRLAEQRLVQMDSEGR